MKACAICLLILEHCLLGSSWVSPIGRCALGARRAPRALLAKRDEFLASLEAAGATSDELTLCGDVVPENVEMATVEWLMQYGFTGGDVASMVRAYPKLLSMNESRVGDVALSVDFLRTTVGLRTGELRKVGREMPRQLATPPSGYSRGTGARFPVFDTGACPAVLAFTTGGPASRKRPTAKAAMAETVELLSFVGLRAKFVRGVLARFPQLLAVEMPQLLAVTDFFYGLGFGENLGSLYKQAPQLLAADVGTTLRPAANFLTDECGVSRLETVIRAYPQALLSTPERMRERVTVLRELGLTNEDVANVIESFPLLVGLDVNATMRPALALWREIGVAEDDVARVARAFPSLLGVATATQQEAIAFLREMGVVSLARFVTRLPPVLAYDVESNLRPKMAFAVRNALSVYDIARFPAYFSYPLHDVLEPRAAFLANVSKAPSPLASWGLNVLLPPSDKAFNRLLGAPPGAYEAFKKARARRLQAERDAEVQLRVERELREQKERIEASESAAKQAAKRWRTDQPTPSAKASAARTAYQAALALATAPPWLFTAPPAFSRPQGTAAPPPRAADSAQTPSLTPTEPPRLFPSLPSLRPPTA